MNVIEREDECLEFSLCGKAATLYVRETSEVCSPLPQEEDEDLMVSTESNKSTADTSKSLARLRFQELSGHTVEDHKKHNVQNLYTKKWSGNTYFEEELRKIRTREYNRELNEAMKRRKLWKQFQREQNKDDKRALIRISAPEWWQEPSRKQIALVTTLGDVIKADKEEGVTGRTRQWLLDLGVETRLTPKQVQTCMKRSLLNPVDFLLEVHDHVVFIQQNAKKRRGHLEKPFSVDERILLTVVSVLQLPTLLTMLHFILPPPVPFPREKHVQEVLFGDLDDESIRYATPYMEPLPFRNQKEFRAWAFDRMFKSLMPSIIKNIPQDRAKERVILHKMSTTPMTSDIFATIVPDIANEKTRLSNLSKTPSVMWLISHYVSKRPHSTSMTPMCDESVRERSGVNRKSFSRKLTNTVQNKTYSTRSRKRGSITKGTPHEQSFKDNYSGDLIPSDLESPNYQKIDLDPKAVPTKLGSSEGLSQNLEGATVSSSQDNTEHKGLRTQVIGNTGHEISSNNIKNYGETQGLKHSVLEILGLQSLWDEIEALPKDKRLRHAIKVLADMGDPLAQLPRIHKLPSVRRWLELRQGKRRILSKKEKDDLLTHSRGMWRSSLVGNMKEIPKIKCTKRKERLLTWDKKNWLTSKITKEMHNYYSRVKTEKVDNARTFFPSMHNPYDYGSKLNRNFRDVFYTYLPAREADMKVFRPWQPHETMGSKHR